MNLNSLQFQWQQLWVERKFNCLLSSCYWVNGKSSAHTIPTKLTMEDNSYLEWMRKSTPVKQKLTASENIILLWTQFNVPAQQEICTVSWKSYICTFTQRISVFTWSRVGFLPGQWKKQVKNTVKTGKTGNKFSTLNWIEILWCNYNASLNH